MKRRSDELPTSSRQEYMSRGKRAKLVNIGVDNPLNLKFDASSMPVGVMKKVRSDDAKTSEFAFFKKLKEDAGQKFASRIADGKSSRSDEFGLRNIRRARGSNNVVNNGYKDVRSSLLVENATPVKFVSFDSPPESSAVTRNSDVHRKKVCMTLEDAWQKQKYREEYSDSLWQEGTQHGYAEVFNRKRQKLHRWVTDVSFPEIDGLCSKGCDAISVLLSRLIPESKDTNNAEDQKFGEVDIDAKSILAPYHKSDIDYKKLQWIPNRDFTDLEFGPNCNEAIPHGWPNRTRGRILYLDAPYSHNNNTHDWYGEWQSDSELLGGNLALCAERDFSFPIPFRRLRFIEPVEELDHLTLPDKYLVGNSNRSDAPMLGWDYDKEEVERNLTPTFADVELNAHPTSSVPWVDNHQHNAGELFSLSNFHDREEYGSALPLSWVSSYHNHENDELQVLEDKENILLDTNHIPLTLSWKNNHLGPPKDCYDDTSFHHQDHWFMSKFVSQGHHHSQTEDLLYSALVLDLGSMCFPLSGLPQERYSSPYHALEYPGNQSLDSCLDDSTRKERPAHFSEESEGDVSIHEWSSSCFEISPDTDKAFPLIHDRNVY